MSGKAKMAHRQQPRKREEARGWHVEPYLTTEEGLTEQEARALAAGLLHGGQVVPPPEEAEE